MHSTEEFEEGWLIVPARWLDLVQLSDRAYQALQGEVMIVVNTLIRLEGDHGVGVKTTTKGKGKGKKWLVSEAEHNKCDASAHVD